MGRVNFRARIADAAENLDHPGAGGAWIGVHRLDHRQKRRAPRRNTHDVRGLQRRLQIEGGGSAQVARDLVFGIDRIHDDGFPKSERRLQLVLELRMQAGRHAERDADDPFFFGALQQPGDGGLMDVQTFGDLGLTETCAVVEARDLREQTQFVDARHDQPLPPCRPARARSTASVQPA